MNYEENNFSTSDKGKGSNDPLLKGIFDTQILFFDDKEDDKELSIITKINSENSTKETQNPLPLCPDHQIILDEINSLNESIPIDYQIGLDNDESFNESLSFNCHEVGALSVTIPVDNQTTLNDDSVIQATPIFRVNKRKKCGRIPRHKIKEISKIFEQNNPYNTIHSNKGFDNILRKIKVHFHKFILKFVKFLIKKEFPNEYKDLPIKKISARVTQDVTIEFNKKQLNSTLYEFLTQKISSKYKLSSQNSNLITLQQTMKRSIIIEKMMKMTYKDFYTNFFLIKNIDFLDFYDECDCLSKILDKLDNQNNYRDYFEKIARESVIAHFQSNKSRKRKPRKKNISSE